MEKMSWKRFGVLMCAEDSEHVIKMYGGYFGVFVKMLKEEKETWDMYKVSCGEFPKDDELSLYDGFVITGSCNDACRNEKWICDLVTLIKKLDSMHTKILGICFGHQEAFAVGARESAALMEPDTDVWRKLCTSFLKSGI